MERPWRGGGVGLPELPMAGVSRGGWQCLMVVAKPHRRGWSPGGWWPAAGQEGRVEGGNAWWVGGGRLAGGWEEQRLL